MKSWSRTRLRTKKGACKEHADPLKWQIKEKEKGQRPRNRGKVCWARIFSWLREHSFQWNKGMQAEQTEEEEVRQQTRMDVMKRMVRRMRAKGRMDVHNRWWVSELLVVDCEKAWLDTEWKLRCGSGMSGCGKKRRRMRGREWKNTTRLLDEMIFSAEQGAGVLAQNHEAG